MCRTPSFATPNKRHAAGQYHIRCCTGDFCNGGLFPDLPQTGGKFLLKENLFNLNKIQILDCDLIVFILNLIFYRKS